MDAYSNEMWECSLLFFWKSPGASSIYFTFQCRNRCCSLLQILACRLRHDKRLLGSISTVWYYLCNAEKYSCDFFFFLLFMRLMAKWGDSMYHHGWLFIITVYLSLPSWSFTQTYTLLLNICTIFYSLSDRGFTHKLPLYCESQHLIILSL